VTIENCYSEGTISGSTSGGICGSETGNSIGTVIVTNCYSAGAITSTDAKGIFGTISNVEDVSSTKCYVANGGATRRPTPV
jgi:hypothetical protein